MRLFTLVRNEDLSGISGTGPVAQGVVFDDGTPVMRWTTHYASTCVYDSMDALIDIHGHGGSTIIEWVE